MLRRGVLRVEDVVQQAVGRGLRSLGRPVQVRVFPGYGGDGWLRVLGRVVVSGPTAPDLRVDRPSTWQVLGANLRQYLTSEVPFARVRVGCGGRTWEVSTDREGYLDVTLDPQLSSGQHTITMTPTDPAGEAAQGTVHVHGGEVGLAVVSDIDDTLIDSGISKGLVATVRTALLHHSAARVPLQGAPALYQALGRDPHDGSKRPFFYLSTSPWNLARFLAGFLDRHGFPAGPLLLTDWGPGNAGWFRIGTLQHKLTVLRRLAGELPSARFILIGDSGQQDVEIYATFALEHPDRVAAVYIRRAHGREELSGEQTLQRARRTFEGAGVPFLLAEDTAAMLRHAQEHALATT